MFIAAVHVYIKPDKVDDFKEMIGHNHRGSIAEPGCLRFDVAQSRDDPTEFLLWECYALPGVQGGRSGVHGQGTAQRPLRWHLRRYGVTE